MDVQWLLLDMASLFMEKCIQRGKVHCCFHSTEESKIKLFGAAKLPLKWASLIRSVPSKAGTMKKVYSWSMVPVYKSKLTTVEYESSRQIFSSASKSIDHGNTTDMSLFWSEISQL